ncbi:MAG: N-acetylmannosamine-6-phosphate 2-epimerase [Terriglobia bacterium]
MRQSEPKNVIKKLKGGLIVSCQQPPNSPLSPPGIIAAMVAVAEQQGAVGARVNGAKNIRAARRASGIPIIGIEKLHVAGSSVYITPTWESVRRVCKAGAAIVALDCTRRRRPEDQSLAEILRRAKNELGAIIMADVATLKEGVAAAELGVDVISTTLCGYTREARHCAGPAFELLAELVRRVAVPVVLEGRVHSPDDLRKGFDLGAHAVVVGAAITDVGWLARQFAQAAPRPTKRLLKNV